MNTITPGALKLLERLRACKTVADLEALTSESKGSYIALTESRQAMTSEERYAFYEREAFRRMGLTTPEQQSEARQASLERAFAGLGLSESAAKIAAAGRNGTPSIELTERRHVHPSNGPAMPPPGGPSETEMPGAIARQQTESAQSRLERAFAGMGFSESAAKLAAAGRS